MKRGGCLVSSGSLGRGGGLGMLSGGGGGVRSASSYHGRMLVETRVFLQSCSLLCRLDVCCCAGGSWFLKQDLAPSGSTC